jgi:hypothetical protein
VQRLLKVGDRNITADHQANPSGSAQQVWTDVTLVPAFTNRAPDVQQKMNEQYWKWVEDQAGNRAGSSNATWGRKEQRRSYDDVVELEKGLHGWVAAKPGRHGEKEHAQSFYQSAEAELRLNKVLILLLDKIENLHRDGSTDRNRQEEITGDLEANNVPNRDGSLRARGTYQYYLDKASEQPGLEDVRTGIQSGFLDVLRNPEEYSFRDKIVTVHDLMEYFGPVDAELPRGDGYGLLPALANADVRATTGMSPRGRDTNTGRGRREGWEHQATRDENNPSTQFARTHELPVWSGHSFTTGRVLKMGQWVSATVNDLTTLAHSLFAFWRLDYDHTAAQAPHTLHEVMDIARNFGVPYNPLDRYSTFRYQDVAGEQFRLKREIDSMTEQAKTKWTELEKTVPEESDGFASKDWNRILDIIHESERHLDSLTKLNAPFYAANTDGRVEIMRTMLQKNSGLRQNVNEVRDLLESR